MIEWKYECMKAWMNVEWISMYEWKYACMKAWMKAWIHVWTNILPGSMHVWKHEWTN